MMAQAVERVKGIEPSWPAWKAGALPLSYTRRSPISVAVPPRSLAINSPVMDTPSFRLVRSEAATRCRYTQPPVRSTVEAVEANKVKLSVEIEAAEFETEVNAAFKR